MSNNPYSKLIQAELGGEEVVSARERTDNPYRAMVEDDLRSLDTLRRQAAAQAASVNPGDARVVADLSQRHGLPAEAVRENRSMIEESERRAQTAGTLSEMSLPAQKHLLSNGLVPTVRDDLPRLKALEDAILNRQWHETERRLRERGMTSNIARGIGGRGMDLASNLLHFANNIANEGEAYIQSLGIMNPGLTFGMVEDFDVQGRVPDFSIGGYGFEFRADIPAEETAGITQAADAIGEVDFDYIPQFTADRIKAEVSVGNVAGFMTEQGLVSLPDMFAALLALPAYIGSRTNEIATTRVENDGGEGQPEIGDLAAAAPAAVASSIIERFAANRLFNPTTTTVQGTIASAVAREAGTEFIQEQIDYAGETLGTKKTFDVMESLERGAFGALAGAGMGGAVSTVQQTYSGVVKFNQARRDQSYLQQVAEASRQAESDNVSPEVLRGLLARSKESAPVKEMFIDAGEFQQLFQSHGLDPDYIAEQMVSTREEYFDTLAVGGDLIVSLEDFAAVVARTAAADDFIAMARTEPAGMTPAQADRWMAETAGPLIEAAQKYDPAVENESADLVYDDVLGQLIATGMDRATAERNASLYRAFFSVMAESEGRDAVDIYSEFGLQIGRPVADVLRRPEAPSILDNMIDRLRAGEVPSDREVYGPSLTDFLRDAGGVRDEGGELAAMDANLTRMPGQRNLVSPEGRSLDDLAELAVEAGYLSERDPNSLLERIRSELRGERVYSEANVNEELRALAADLAVLDDELRKIGADLSQLSNRQVLDALNGQTEGFVGVLEQSGDGVRATGSVHTPPETGPADPAQAHRERFEQEAAADQLAEEQSEALYIPPEVDPVTGLYADAELAAALKRAGSGTYIEFDLGSLSKVNNALGSNANADAYLKGLSEILTAAFPDALVFRRTGGRFGVIAPEGSDLTADFDALDARVSELAERYGLAGLGGNAVLYHGISAFSPESAIDEIIAPAQADIEKKKPETEEDVQRKSAFRGRVAAFAGQARGIAGRAAAANQGIAGESGQAGSRVPGPQARAASPRKGQLDPEALRDQQYLALADAVGLAPELRDKYRPITKTDSLLKGWYTNADRMPTLERARELVEQTDTPSWYIWVDISNLGGMTDTLGREGADDVFQAQADITLRHLQELGVEIVPFRHGGDELSFVVTGDADQAAIDAALQAAREEVQRYANTIDAQDIPHKKYPKDATKDGTGIYVGVARVQRGDDVAETIKRAERIGEASKLEGQPDVGGETLPLRGSPDSLYQQDKQTPAEAGVSRSGVPEDARGRILFDRENKRFRIELLEKANLSTFLHESGHYFLEVLGGLADSPQASDRLRQTYADALKWMGVESRDQIQTEQHEMFARAFEAYLREGNAPNPEMRDIFQRFKAWLKQIYKHLSQLNVTLTDDVRSVFDRMLATDAQIAMAADDAGYNDMLADLDIGWTDADRERLRELRIKAREQAEETLMREQMRDMEKADQRWWAAEQEKVSMEVADQLNADRVYQARAMLTSGLLPDGTEPPTGRGRLKLDKQLLVEEFGFEYLKRLPSPKNPNNKAPGYVYTNDGGADPDVVARFYGFQSARELVDALIASRPIDQYKEALAEATMRDRYPDINLSGEAAELAHQAVYNDGQAQLMMYELKKLESRAGRQPTVARLLKEKAGEIIASKRVRDIKPVLYARKVNRYAGEAFAAAAAGDLNAAVAAKQKQLLHHYLYRESVEAREAADRVFRYAKTFDKKATRERLFRAGDGYMDRIDDIIDQYEFKRVSLRALNRRESLREWMAREQEAGRHVDIPPEVLDRANQVNWQDVSLAELLAVEESIKNIEHVARLKSTLISQAEERDLQQVVDAAVERIMASAKDGQQFGYQDLGSLRYRFADAKNQYLSIFLNPDSLVRQLDGWEDLGPVYDATKGIIDRAVTEKLLPMQEKYLQQLADLFNNHYTRAEQRKFSKKSWMNVPGLGGVSKDMALSLALNWGNEYNRESVMAGVVGGQRALTAPQARQILDGLDKRDWDFVQSVWDMLDHELWPLVQAKEKARKGYAPEKVQAATVVTPHGVYRGGYYPVKFEQAFSFRVTEEEANELAKAVRVGRFSKAATRRGHTMERTGTGGRPVQLSLSALYSHINQVTADLALGDAVNDVQKVIGHEDFVDAMDASGNTWVLKALDSWLKDTAAGEVIPSDMVSKAVRHVRTGFTISKLGWNIGTILMQPLGVFQTMGQIGTRPMLRGLSMMGKAPWLGESSIFKEVEEQSVFMKQRGASFNKDISDTLRAMRKSGWGEAIFERILGEKIGSATASAIRESMMGGIVATQRLVDTAVWLGAYEQGKGKFVTDQEARQYADRMVARTQASGIFSDRSAIERGTLSNNTRQSEFVRIWTTLASYMFAKGNIAYEKTKRTEFRDPAQVMSWASDMAMLFIYEALIIAAIRGGWPDEDDDESVVGFVAGETLANVTSSFPFLREVSSELAGFRGGSALTQLYMQIGKTAAQVEQGEADAVLLKQLNNLGGIIFHYPSSQTNRTMEALWRDLNGEDVSASEYLIYRERD